MVQVAQNEPKAQCAPGLGWAFLLFLQTWPGPSLQICRASKEDLSRQVEGMRLAAVPGS